MCRQFDTLRSARSTPLIFSSILLNHQCALTYSFSEGERKNPRCVSLRAIETTTVDTGSTPLETRIRKPSLQPKRRSIIRPRDFRFYRFHTISIFSIFVTRTCSLSATRSIIDDKRVREIRRIIIKIIEVIYPHTAFYSRHDARGITFVNSRSP